MQNDKQPVVTDEMVEAYKRAYNNHLHKSIYGFIPSETADISREGTRRGLEAALSPDLHSRLIEAEEAFYAGWKCRDDHDVLIEERVSEAFAEWRRAALTKGSKP